MATLLEYTTQDSTYSFTASTLFDVYQQFTATGDWTVEEVYINAVSLMGARFLTGLEIYGDNGSDQPDLGNQKGGRYLINVVSPGYVGGTLSSAAVLVSGTKYWIRFDNGGGNNDGANLGIDTGEGYAHPSLKWNGLSYDTLNHDFNFRLIGSTPPTPPDKAINPTPANAANDVTLDQETITWEDGGDADTYDVYYGESGGSLVKVSSEQVGTSFTISGITSGSPFDYIISRSWRIDSINAQGTTTGDVWSFTTIRLSPPAATYWYVVGPYFYQLLIDTNGNYGSPPPGGVENTDYVIVPNPNPIVTPRRLVVAANDKIWYEVL